MKIDKLNKSTSVKDYLHKTSGVDQGNAEQLNKTTTFVSVFNISGLELRKTLFREKIRMLCSKCKYDCDVIINKSPFKGFKRATNNTYFSIA